jgi:hypothetical protein
VAFEQVNKVNAVFLQERPSIFADLFPFYRESCDLKACFAGDIQELRVQKKLKPHGTAMASRG